VLTFPINGLTSADPNGNAEKMIPCITMLISSVTGEVGKTTAKTGITRRTRYMRMLTCRYYGHKHPLGEQHTVATRLDVVGCACLIIGRQERLGIECQVGRSLING
jgi:hypothetical protein